MQRKERQSREDERQRSIIVSGMPCSAEGELAAEGIFIYYFYELEQLKSILRDVDKDIKHLVGEDVNVMVAARRCPTIRDNVVKNRFFSKDTGTSRPPFKACKSSRCLTCPIYKSSGSVMINSVVFNISNKFNCKTDNCIYLAVCKFCREKGCSDNAYVGQTTQPLHRRMNGHRACFVLVEAKLEKSALSGGGGVTPLRAPTPLCQNRVCLTRGVSSGAYRGAQGRSLKNTWKMFVFNCMIHFVTCIVTIFPIMELLGYP